MLTPPPPHRHELGDTDGVLITDRWVGNRCGDRRWTRPRHLLVWLHRPAPPRLRPICGTRLAWKPTPVHSSRRRLLHVSSHQVVRFVVVLGEAIGGIGDNLRSVRKGSEEGTSVLLLGLFFSPLCVS